DVGTRSYAEYGIAELDIAGSLAVELLNLNFHGSALLTLIGFGRVALAIAILLGRLFSLGRRARSLLSEQRFGLFRGRTGVDFVLGSRFDHAGRSFLVLRQRALLLQN